MAWVSGFESILHEQAPLAERTWLRVGGPAAWLAEPTSVEQLAELVRCCHEEDRPVRLLGGGSNLLVPDDGVAGVVLNLSAPCFTQLRIDQQTVIAGGGASLAHAVSEAVGAGLAGLEPLVGIPGTIGGALHGNAGSHGGDLGQWTNRATVLTRSGELLERQRQDLVFAYRQSSLDELVIVEAAFQLEEDEQSALMKRMQKQWIVTKASQPMTHENTACIFKDPRGMSVETLIEHSGLKGAVSGGAELSSRHANFVVTHPGATSQDVLSLIEQLQLGVSERMGVDLETQIEVW